MKIKILSLALVCLILSFCTAAPREKLWVPGPYPTVETIKSNYKPFGQQTLMVEDTTYDLVWKACENTLIGLGCQFYLSDKNAGEIIVSVTTKADIAFGDNKGGTIRPSKSYKLSLLLSEANENISVQASALIPNNWKPVKGPEMNQLENEINKIVRALKKKLKIQE